MTRKRWQYYACKNRASKVWEVIGVEYGMAVTESLLPGYSASIGPHRTKQGADYMALACNLGAPTLTASEADRLARETVNSRLARALRADPQIRSPKP